MSFKYWCVFLQNVITLYYPISHSSSSRTKNNFSSNSPFFHTHSQKCILRGVLLTIRKTNGDRESECPLILCFLFETNCFNLLLFASGMKAIFKLKTVNCCFQLYFFLLYLFCYFLDWDSNLNKALTMLV